MKRNGRKFPKVFQFINTLTKFGHETHKDTREILVRSPGKYLINIGAGDWECPGWINLDYPSEWYASAQNKHKFIPFDIRNDTLPFKNDTVQDIYCSHVIEHIENRYVAGLFLEAYRVMCVGGVFRIACPDSEFLYQMAKLGKEYWNYRKRTFDRAGANFEEMRPVDCLIREVATPRLSRNNYHIGTKYQQEFDNMTMNDFLEFITDGLEFDANYVGDHINFWTYEKLAAYLSQAGFSKIIRSKCQGSSSYNMQDRRYFDITQPGMSIYVEAIK